MRYDDATWYDEYQDGSPSQHDANGNAQSSYDDEQI